MITIATYNVLHGFHEQLILKSIRELISRGVDILMLQEADPPFEQALNNLFKTGEFDNWQAEYFHAGYGGNVAIVWNSANLRVRDINPISLPIIPGRVLPQRILGQMGQIQRGALSITFQQGNKTVRVTNAHLAWEGGLAQRAKQLVYLNEFLGQRPVDADIVGGDFNTFTTWVLPHFEIKKLSAILGSQFTSILPALPWSYDISYNAPEDGYDTLAKICRFLGIKLRSRLDYIFVRSLTVLSAEMLDLPGSDHRPLLGRFDF